MNNPYKEKLSEAIKKAGQNLVDYAGTLVPDVDYIRGIDISVEISDSDCMSSAYPEVTVTTRYLA